MEFFFYMNPDEMIKNVGRTKLYEEASIIRRLGAFLVDLLILDFFVFGSLSILIKDVPDITSFQSIANFELTGTIIAIFVFAGILGLAYHSLLEYSLSATLGMTFFNLQLSEKTSFPKCVLRNIFIIPIFPFTLFWIADPIYLIIKKRRLLEEITKTKTVKI